MSRSKQGKLSPLTRKERAARKARNERRDRAGTIWANQHVVKPRKFVAPDPRSKRTKLMERVLEEIRNAK